MGVLDYNVLDILGNLYTFLFYNGGIIAFLVLYNQYLIFECFFLIVKNIVF